ncbi:hypothetical protein BALAC2494_01815 [Bifidobacterium animalis subsp. lactis CNCM I-2494]|uniref:Uncharacterized protein n=1 Tax=Bifidobacterium animalis subsp. lactis CNCM I-2494 TaxID=1042403 RepID=A0A806FKG9_BIFAN|nr:hypothetical protein BALAC2494_01815 [Bifidobacterium animalis subsp. lactis CNCM I-2494]
MDGTQLRYCAIWDRKIIHQLQCLAVTSECSISANSRCVCAPERLRNKSVPGTRYGSNTGSLIGMYYLSFRPYRAHTRRPNVAASISPFA